jgi:hypothetical protein
MCVSVCVWNYIGRERCDVSVYTFIRIFRFHCLVTDKGQLIAVGSEYTNINISIGVRLCPFLGY